MFWAIGDSRSAPDGRRAGRPHPADPCGGANIPILKSPRCGGRERPPYETGGNRAANREITAAQGPRGRICNPPLRFMVRRAAKRETAKTGPKALWLSCGFFKCARSAQHLNSELFSLNSKTSALAPPSGGAFALHVRGVSGKMDKVSTLCKGGAIPCPTS